MIAFLRDHVAPTLVPLACPAPPTPTRARPGPKPKLAPGERRAYYRDVARERRRARAAAGICDVCRGALDVPGQRCSACKKARRR